MSSMFRFRCCAAVACILAAPALLLFALQTESLLMALVSLLLVVGACLLLVLLLVPRLLERTHKSVSQLTINSQAWIAKGRKHQQRVALEGNLAPVQAEVYEAQCRVVAGALPHNLDGVFMRNGSNPYFDPTANYLLFDGDGMVHAVRIKDGAASYCNHWVQTHRLQQEQQAQQPLFAKLGDLQGVRGLCILLLELLKYKLGIIQADQGAATANTSLVFHSNRLLALHEVDLPYQLRVMCDGVVETVGRLQVGDWSAPFTAHPKLEASTGNLHIIGYYFERLPYLRYGILGPDGELLKHFPIEIPFPSMFHDFAITKNYAVILHMPLVFDPVGMLKNNTVPVVFKPELPSRVGLLPLTANSGDETVWYELPPFYAFHVANAWEDDSGVVKIFACKMNNVDLTLENITPDDRPFMTEITANPATGTANMRRVSQLACDFPIVHPHLQGKQSKYAYVAIIDVHDAGGRVKGFSKLDLLAPSTQKECSVASIELEDLAAGGEPLFVPRSQDVESCTGEDDGYIMMYVTKADGSSYLHIYDALTMSSMPVAKVQLPQRVPLGFHSLWMTAEQIKQQDNSSTRSGGAFTLQNTKGDVGCAMKDVQRVSDV